MAGPMPCYRKQSSPYSAFQASIDLPGHMIVLDRWKSFFKLFLWQITSDECTHYVAVGQNLQLSVNDGQVKVITFNVYGICLLFKSEIASDDTLKERQNCPAASKDI